ncbi:hypothetical protein [Nonomuraea lactucae]|uniref:hypothetical protein n=1 Tax=Nonomuraea lactucae TaxID=2249762 RepID=UPI0013B365ED|nr:hypothetical protein [Nonomuraea lactucae]
MSSKVPSSDLNHDFHPDLNRRVGGEDRQETAVVRPPAGPREPPGDWLAIL